ncbi:preprotein translocase subunit SecE [candidate division WWE3 bacterium RIFCSPLOWO2_01_FULL_41_9]|uniref:Protein translocase subunit SecE n=1 Tax=candidate division WWE3 bacterium RIFCSPLOWO2_01_FULL_41_9 TaxID=1802626 RepID=A0A1F4VL66_UNCKA|nr:MAG: preprotein translocase subunit SecE [candidate division WWE3 bacterium RIFCSPLOWO2_01_FULL_41_9]
MQKLIGFIKNAYYEFERVQWPNRQETIRLTAYVIGVSLATGLVVSGFDFGFKEALALIIK